MDGKSGLNSFSDLNSHCLHKGHLNSENGTWLWMIEFVAFASAYCGTSNPARISAQMIWENMLFTTQSNSFARISV